MINDSLKFGLNPLRSSRKADREMLANAFVKIAAGWGATVERIEDGREISLTFELHGVRCHIGIDQDLANTFTMINWSTTEPETVFSQRFQRCVGQVSDHNYPHHKATTIPADWFSLAAFLDAGLTLAFRGDAIEERKAA